MVDLSDIDLPNIKEINRAIKNQKNNKAVRTDNIPEDTLKAYDTIASQMLHPLNQIWNEECLLAELSSFPRKATSSIKITVVI